MASWDGHGEASPAVPARHTKRCEDVSCVSLTKLNLDRGVRGFEGHFQGTRVADSSISRLELGAGGGLVGLSVALELELMGRKDNKLLMTDQLQMLDLMKTNIGLNDLSDSVDASILNW